MITHGKGGIAQSSPPDGQESTMPEQQKNRTVISMTCRGHIFHKARGSSGTDDVAAPTYVVTA
jgi:hypothetical protein